MNCKATKPIQVNKNFYLFLFPIISLITPLIAKAQISPALDSMSISIGALKADPNLNVSLSNASGSIGTGDVGLGEKVMPRIKAEVVLFGNQGLSLDYYRYKNDYSGAFSHTTSVNNNPITTAGNANIDINFDFGKLAYKWWIGKGDTVLGLGLGAAYYKVNLKASASASINNANTTIGGDYIEDAYAPLIEIAVRHAFNSDLRLFMEASSMKKSGGRLNGEINNVSAGVEWFPLKNIGVVLTYGLSEINLNRLGSNDVNFNYKIQGPSGFIKVRY